MDARDRILRLVTFMLILVLGFVLYRTLITPKRQGINSLRQNLKNIEFQINDLLGEEVTPGAGELGEEQLDDYLQKLIMKIPSERDIPKIINQLLTQVGKNLSIDYTLIQPQPLQPKGRYKKLPIELKFSTTYPNFNTYLTQLKELPEVFVIDSLDLRRIPGKADRISVHLVISAFVMPGGVERKLQAITMEAYPEVQPQTSPFLPMDLPKRIMGDWTPGEGETPALVLQGILYGDLKAAIINDNLLYTGDSIEGYRVVNIRPTSVVLKRGAKTIILGLEK